MKILKIVAYISPDGAYGGPVRVALNQAKGLQQLGNEVLLVAASGGFNGNVPEEIDGVPVKLFPGHRVVPGGGFAGMTSPSLLRWLWAEVGQADVVHVHMARDLTTLPSAGIARIFRKNLVIQTHGMISPSGKFLAKVLDALITKPILHSADAVLYLTQAERNKLCQVTDRAVSLKHLPNGVTVPEMTASEQNHGPQRNPKIVFLARMHARKRPLFVVRAALTLQHKWPNAHFELIGPDEGEGRAVLQAAKEANLSDYVSWGGAVPLHHTMYKLLGASLFVLPSIDEPFGMSVAEAMAVGLPVVITEGCGLARVVSTYNAGLVCDETQEGFTLAVDKLLSDDRLRVQFGKNARQVAINHLSMETVVETLVKTYSNIMITRVVSKYEQKSSYCSAVRTKLQNWIFR